MVTVDFMAERELESLKQENEALKTEVAVLKQQLQNLIDAYDLEVWGPRIEWGVP